MARAVPYDESKWKAEADARSLMEAYQIQKDPARLKAAKAAARRMAKEAQAAADAHKQTAGMK